MRRITLKQLLKAGAYCEVTDSFKVRFGKSCTILEFMKWIKEVGELGWFGWFVCQVLISCKPNMHCEDCIAYKVKYVGKKMGYDPLFSWFSKNTAKAATNRAEHIIDKIKKEK